jgi:hypothetical protein
MAHRSLRPFQRVAILTLHRGTAFAYPFECKMRHTVGRNVFLKVVKKPEALFPGSHPTLAQGACTAGLEILAVSPRPLGVE